jgi:RNA polymerase sigma-70 factor (ECF subfamily)
VDPSAPESSPVELHVLGGGAPLDWEVVYRDNVLSIYRLMYSKVGNKADAEDLTSQVFVGALPRLRSTASGGEIHRYLLATARTVLADHWRRRLGHPLTEIHENVTLLSTPVAGWKDPLPRIRRILATLPQNYRRILELRFLEQRSVREAADLMGVSPGNARILQHRALRRAAELGVEAEA